jgi:hypothetical protein
MERDVVSVGLESASDSVGSELGGSERAALEPLDGAAEGAVRAVSAERTTLLPAPPRPRGRCLGYRMPEEWRAKIQTGMAISFLHRVVRGKMDHIHPACLSQRVQSAKILLGKTVPDLAAVQVIEQAERRIEITTVME